MSDQSQNIETVKSAGRSMRLKVSKYLRGLEHAGRLKTNQRKRLDEDFSIAVQSAVDRLVMEVIAIETAKAKAGPS